MQGNYLVNKLHNVQLCCTLAACQALPQGNKEERKMTKSETREVAKLEAVMRNGFTGVNDPMIGYCARSYSALIRATMTTKSRNEIICFASGVPAVIQHADFIV